jgi:dihydropteroate synthase
VTAKPGVAVGGWQCRGRVLPVGERVHVMGILNVTPDSFSDGGLFATEAEAVRRGVEMAGEGADILDVGGESTRPGAPEVPAGEEAARVVPVVRALARSVDVPISVDTTKAAVAEAALEAGAVIVNDVSAMRMDPDMRRLVAASGAGVVLMHMLGNPRTMQANPRYGDVVAEVEAALLGWASEAESAGIGRDRIAVDPGIGFGKTAAHNLSLLRHLDRLVATGYPVLVGPSRKSFIGLTLGLPLEQRLEGTAAAVAWSAAAGARIVRVHDVRPMVRVVRMTEAILGAP